jgi:hypothetical protein
VHEPNNKKNQIKKSLKTHKSQHIKLSNNIEVYLTYQTVWLTSDGKLQWADDIYQLDQPLILHSQLNAQLNSQLNFQLSSQLNSTLSPTLSSNISSNITSQMSATNSNLVLAIP